MGSERDKQAMEAKQQASPAVRSQVIVGDARSSGSFLVWDVGRHQSVCVEAGVTDRVPFTGKTSTGKTKHSELVVSRQSHILYQLSPGPLECHLFNAQ